SVTEALGSSDDVRRDAPLLDPEPLATSPPPSGLHFVADPDAAVITNDLLDDLEVLLRWRHKSADPLNRFRDESRDPPAGRGPDQLLHVLRTAHVTTRISQPEGTAIAICIMRVHHAGLRRPELPCALSRNSHRHRRTSVIRVPQRHDLRAPRITARRK